MKKKCNSPILRYGSSIDEEPWCKCLRGKTDGYKQIEADIWVHSVCSKPTKMFWINKVLLDKYWEELDLIIERIITKTEYSDGMDKGRAEIACLFIAMLLRPHAPDIKYVRDLAVKRYRDRWGSGG